MKNIFVSSTFMDFQYERDALRSKVMPAVNNVAQGYGEYISFCDLRWGIDTSDKSENSLGTIINECLNEIDRSRPYMIVLLGNRYGFVPDEELIKNEAVKRKIAIDHYDISVTQLEIEYGALLCDSSNAYFYFREIINDADIDESYFSESEDYRKKLVDLKKRVKEKFGDRVKFYQVRASQLAHLDEFVNMVTTDLCTEVEKKWIEYKSMSIYEKDIIQQFHFIEEKANVFSIYENLANIVVNNICKKRKKKISIITGNAGGGKSTLFSKICLEAKEKGVTVIPFVCGNTIISSHENGILESLIWQLEEILEIDHSESSNSTASEIQKKRHRFDALCLKLENRRVLIAIDGIEQLVGVNSIEHYIFMPRAWSKNLKVLITSNKVIKIREAELFSIDILDDCEKHKVINSILESHGKRLSPVVIDEIVKKSSSNNPLYLYMLVNRLCIMNFDDFNVIYSEGGEIENINQHQINIISSVGDKLSEIAVDLINNTTKMICYEPLKRCVEYIAVSKNGLRFDDLKVLLSKEGINLIPLHFSRLVNFLMDLFLQRDDGRYDFFHQVMRDGITSSVSPNTHYSIAEYLIGLHKNDELRKNETVFHLFKSGKDQELFEFVANSNYEHKYLVEDIFTDFISNGDEWLRSTLNKYFNENVSEEFLRFIDILFYNASTRLKDNIKSMNLMLEIGEEYGEILVKIINKTEHYADKINSMTHQYMLRVLSCIYLMNAEILQKFGNGKNGITKCANYYNKYIAISEKLTKKFPNVYSISTLSEAYCTAAKYADTLGNTQLTLDLLRHSVNMKKELAEYSEAFHRNYEIARSNIASFLMYILPENDIKSIESDLVESMKYLKKLSESSDSSNDLYNYSEALRRTANYYSQYAGKNCIIDSMSLYHEFLDVREKYYINSKTDDSMENLIEAYLTVGNAYIRMGSKEYLLKALELCERNYEFVERKFKELQNPEMLDMMMRISGTIGNAALALDGSYYITKAEKYCHKSSTYARKLFKYIPSNENLTHYVKSIIDEVTVICGQKKDNGIKRSITLLKTCLDIFPEDVLSSVEESNSISAYIDLNSHLGNTLLMSGSQLDLNQASEYYKNALNASDILINNFGRSRTLRENRMVLLNNLSTCLDNAAQALNCVLESLKEAKELYEKYGDDKSKKDLAFGYIYCGNAYYSVKDKQKAIDCYVKAAYLRKELFEKLETINLARGLALVYGKIADIYHVSSEMEDKIFCMKYRDLQLETSIKVAELSGTNVDNIAIANAYVEYAIDIKNTYQNTNEYDDKIFELYNKALQQWKKVNQNDLTYDMLMLYVTNMRNISMWHIVMEKHETADQIFNDILNAMDAFIANHNDAYYVTMICDVKMDYAGFYEMGLKDGWIDKSLSLYEDCIKLMEDILSRDTSLIYKMNTSSIYFSAGKLCYENDMSEKALKYLKKSLKYAEKIPIDKRTNMKIKSIFEAQSMIGSLLVQKGNTNSFNEAEIFINKAMFSAEGAMIATGNLNNKSYDEMERVEYYLALNNRHLALIMQEKGDKEAAVEYYGRSFCVFFDMLKSNHKKYIDDLICSYSSMLFLIKDINIFDYKEFLLCTFALNNVLEKEDGHDELKSTLNLIIKDLENMGISTEPIPKDRLIKANELYMEAEVFLFKTQSEGAIRELHKFLDFVEVMPYDEWDEELFIRVYNANSLIAVHYTNKNEYSSLRKAIPYYETAVKYEMMLLKKNVNKAEEIKNDLIEDIEHLVQVKHSINDHESILDYIFQLLNLFFEGQLPDTKEYAKKIIIYASMFSVLCENNIKYEAQKVIVISMAESVIKVYPELIDELRTIFDI